MEGNDDLVFQPNSHSQYPLPRRSSIADVAQQESTTRSIIMMLALSLDSILEGVTTGLKTTAVEVWAIFIGNLVHETVIAFCLGLQLVRVHNTTRPVVIAAIAYSLMNPVGLVVATVVFESLEADPRIDLFNGLFQALTSGVFIYVTFCEILEGQITHRTSYMKILFMFSGFAVLAAFAAVPGSTSYSLAALMPCEHLSNVTTASPSSWVVAMAGYRMWGYMRLLVLKSVLSCISSMASMYCVWVHSVSYRLHFIYLNMRVLPPPSDLCIYLFSYVGVCGVTLLV